MAAFIQRRSASPGVSGAELIGWAAAGGPPPAGSLLGHVLAGAALLAFLLPAAGRPSRRALLPGLLLALLHVRLLDHHRLGDILHRATGLQVLVHLLAVHRATEARTCRPERQQRDSDDQRDSSHAWASLRLHAALVRQRRGQRESGWLYTNGPTPRKVTALGCSPGGGLRAGGRAGHSCAARRTRERMRVWVAVVLVGVAVVPAHGTPVLRRIDVLDDGAVVRLHLSRPVPSAAHTLPAEQDAPPRIYLDLPGTELAPMTSRLMPGAGELLRVRAGQLDPTTIRVVLDLARAVPFDVEHDEDTITVTLRPGPAAGPPSRARPPTRP